MWKECSIAVEQSVSNMQSVVKEDELMSRLEMLENQLQVYSRVSPHCNKMCIAILHVLYV